MGVVNKLIRGYYADNGGLPTWNNNKALEEGRWKTPFFFNNAHAHFDWFKFERKFYFQFQIVIIRLCLNMYAGYSLVLCR